MNRERRTNTRQRSRAPAWVAVALLLLLPMASHAQDGQPRNPDAVGFTTVGVHELNDCKQGKGRLTGILYPLGKLSKNGPVAWLLQHERCDTIIPNNEPPTSLWLVQSTNGLIPPLDDHQVIGAGELAAETRFVGAGDYDGNGILDIAVRIQRFNDTSFGNNKGYGLGVVAVFYGSSTYHYSLQDTVQISDGGDAWFGGTPIASYDVNDDGADELLVRSGLGWKAGVGRIPVAEIVGFMGTPGKKWGHDGASNRRVWEWWQVPKVLPSNSFGYWERRDADCDGVQDLVIYTNNVLGGTGGLQVIYGTASGGFPDTTAIDVLDFTPIIGEASVLSDVTGDGVPDLVVSCGKRDVIEIFAGKPGQRLQELYGTGTDSADRATGRRPVRPWAHLALPHAINDAWFRGIGAIKLGDADGDGVDEIWGESFPYIMGYRGLDALDSLGDIIYRGEVHYAYRIRDLYVSGFPVIVFTNNSRIGYYRIVEPPFPNSYTSYALPHDPDFRCQHASAVADGDPVPPSAALAFTVEPNPATAQQRITWQPTDGTATITVHTMQGEPIWTTTLAATNGVATWQTDTLASGVYTITLTINTTSETQTTTITH